MKGKTNPPPAPKTSNWHKFNNIMHDFKGPMMLSPSLAVKLLALDFDRGELDFHQTVIKLVELNEFKIAAQIIIERYAAAYEIDLAAPAPPQQLTPDAVKLSETFFDEQDIASMHPILLAILKDFKINRRRKQKADFLLHIFKHLKSEKPLVLFVEFLISHFNRFAYINPNKTQGVN